MRYMPDAARGIAYLLYQRVNRELALRGWTHVELQRKSGVARSTISNWATGQQPPTPARVNAVADALGIDRAEALRLAGILTDAPPPASVRAHLADVYREIEQQDDGDDVPVLTEEEMRILATFVKMIRTRKAARERDEGKRGA
jgi:transcriptional regulator with XRE-family HTH domain